MAEAAEIAKLRLFLKLAAQLDSASHIEPLPDLDFNIKSGNLLVGIADAEDIDRRFSGRGVLPFGFDEVEDAVESAAVAYEEFVAIQDSTDDQAALHRAKDLLRTRIGWITDQADRGLHKMRGDVVPLETWRETHKPFHWFAEFPTFWRNGGFDVIIGNPPYIGLKGKRRKQFQYKWMGYEAGNCPDIYAVCTERATTLANANGRFAMIVMHSICFHKGFFVLREFLQRRFAGIWISTYWGGRSGLFAGSAGVRNSILIGKQGGKKIGIHTSIYRRWLTEGRDLLFPTLEYACPDQSLFAFGPSPMWPFVGPGPVLEAFTSLVGNDSQLNNVLQQRSDFPLGYKTTALYQLGVYKKEPPTVDPITRKPAYTSSQRSGWLYFENATQRNLALMVLAGRWAYLWWLAYGDEFAVTRGVLAALPCDIERLSGAAASGGVPSDPPCDMELVSLVERLLACSEALQLEMPNHIRWMVKAGVDVGRYDLGELRHLTDEADWLLAQAWGLSREQYDAAGNLRDRMTFGSRE